MEHVLIFKTNIASEDQYQQASLLLESTTSILKWNIDREDVDKVLRIESTHPYVDEIAKILIEGGFNCEELID